MRQIRAFVASLLAVVFAACAANDHVPRRASRDGFSSAEAPAPAAAAEKASLAFDLGSGGWDDKHGARRDDLLAAPESQPAAEPMLIYRGQVRVEVGRPDEVMANFRAQVTAWGGHLQRQADRTLVVRVPSSRFEEAFQWVRAAGRVLAEARQAEDVTEEFVDLGIRLDTARKARDRLLEVLKRAEKVEDVLKVEAELRRLTDEIERMEGRRKLLADQVAMSTLEATFQAVTEAPVAKRVRTPNRFGWINRIGAERVMEDF